jgi:tetratricopeptide (TPR) repeat protein
MRSIDSTARAIDALIQANEGSIALDLLRLDFSELVAGVGITQVRQWCTQLGLNELLDVQAALEEAHSIRDEHGSASIAAYDKTATLAAALDDPIAELKALAGMFGTGLLLWTGFREMQLRRNRIELLYVAHGGHLSALDALDCLPGVLAERVLFADVPQEANTVGERILSLVLDDQLPASRRVRAATILQPWIAHGSVPERLVTLDKSLKRALDDETVSAISKLTYRAAHVLGLAHHPELRGERKDLRVDLPALLREADALNTQWLRFFSQRVAYEYVSRSGHSDAATQLNQLEALVNPADRSQQLAVLRRRALEALYAHDYAKALACAQRCLELVTALEIESRFSTVYSETYAGALIGVARYDEAIEVFESIIATSPAAYRLSFEKTHALAVAAQALTDAFVGRQSGEQHMGTTAPVSIENAVKTYLQACEGRLNALHARMHPRLVARIAAGAFEYGFGTTQIADDVRSLEIAPPESRTINWPWLLRIRLFEGYECEGLVNAADSGKKGDSKSAQLLQYLGAFAPASVSVHRLADALWPDVDGDRAMRSLDVALTRLRPTLPDTTLIVRHEGKIGLDMKRVWCDTEAVHRLIDAIQERAEFGGDATTRRHNGARARLTLKLLDLYRGPLLPDSRESFAHQRAAYFRAKVSSAVQIGLREALALKLSTVSLEIVRAAMLRGISPMLMQSVITEFVGRKNEHEGDNEPEPLLQLLRD